ncbi:MAG: DUF262 domain-containing protein [Chloracidobacterium sp.]|nr:DUF262 domain-containing protein [Chloracidobacterium sp.]
MAKVYLDALLPREDFEAEETETSMKKKESFSISDIRETDFFYRSLRKPDFQRETNEWDPKRVVQLVKSFVDGELIPAIILWHSKSGLSFVIDGSHRLSSLIAWINDDYGSGTTSKTNLQGLVPEEQIAAAARTRKLVEKQVGRYSDYVLAASSPEKVAPEIAARAKKLGALAVQLQWVEGNAQTAETSFFNINQQAVKINETELKLIKSRKRPNGIAARAIIKEGQSHHYWSKFSQEVSEQIEELSHELSDLMFLPKLKNPVKTLDLPIGGKGYSAQSPLLVFELVNAVNNVGTSELNEDIDGAVAVQFLKNTLKVVRRVNSLHPSSLGLHPAVYFYSRGGRHKSASFSAIIEFLIELDSKRLLKEFTSIRSIFEDILLDDDYIPEQILRHHRTAAKAVPHITTYFRHLMEHLLAAKKIPNFTIVNDDVVREVLSKKEYRFVKTVAVENESSEGESFSDETKSAVFITEALQRAIRCKICNARMHINSITIDHIQRKSEGGTAALDNAQVAHPFCNTTVKH